MSIDTLTVHEPDRKRAERTRARCHRAMERNRRLKSRPAWAPSRLSPRLVEAAVIATVSAIFLIEVVRRALQLSGL